MSPMHARGCDEDTRDERKAPSCRFPATVVIPEPTVGEAIRNVTRYLSRWADTSGHPDHIHSVWTRSEDGEPVTLRASDLRALLDSFVLTVREGNAPVTVVNGSMGGPDYWE
jgi:hypothetical protein